MKLGKCDRGFTLVEMLLAFAIFSVIALVLFGGFLAASDAVQYTEGSLLKLHEMRQALDAMRRELEAAQPDPDNHVVVMDRDVYGKAASGLAFTTASSPLNGAARVTYYILADEKTGRMSLMKKVRLAWEDEKEAREAEVLEEVESFLVELDSGGQWVKTFDGAERPSMVRVTLAAPVGRKSLALTETARPMAGAAL